LTRNGGESTLQELVTVLTEAIEREKSERDKYLQQAQKSTTPGIKLMFEQLAREEEEHTRLLEERLRAIYLLYPQEQPEAVVAPTKPAVKGDEITPKRFQDFMKALNETGFMTHLVDRKLVVTEEGLNQYLKDYFRGKERLEDLNLTIKQDQMDFDLKVVLLKDLDATSVFTSTRLKSYHFDRHAREFEFELLEPRDVLTNSLVGELLVGILVYTLQEITNSKVDLAKILDNKDFLEVISTKININLNDSFYLGSIFGSHIKGIKVFDFLRIEKIEVLPGQLVVYPVLTMITT